MLRASGINKNFNGTQALCAVTLDVARGEVHALVGENGAGKSTLGKILAGVLKPDAGEIQMDRAVVSFASPRDAQSAGIGMIFQELDLFPNLTVADNLVIGSLSAERGAFIGRRSMDRFSEPLLKEVGLEISPRAILADLSMGQQQLVAIARALGMQARLLIMDEPTSALFEDSAERLFELIARLKQRGVTIIYVSHKMNEILRLADRITVLRDGRYIATRKASELAAGEVVSMMVGRELTQTVRESYVSDRVLLRVRSLSTRKLRDIDFDLHAGEVLGVAGLVGSGRSSLGAVLFGLDSVAAGQIERKGNRVGLVPEDRKLDGLMMQMSVVENLSLSALGRFQRFSFLLREEERSATAGIRDRLKIRTASLDSQVGTLSGGNQQKVLLGRWLLADPAILFLDDPARGIDVAAKRDIYEVIRALSAAGKGVILVSSELPELLECSDRILVLHEGHAMGILSRAEATQERVMALATAS